MSEVAQGPGWWRAADGHWYPPEQHPYYQGSLPPPPPPPVGGYSPYATAPTVAAPPQPARLSLTGTAWLIVLGALGVFVSVFLTWATATVHTGFGVVETGTAHLTGAGRFVGIVVAIGVVALSAPVFTGGTVSRKRVIGLIVLVAIFTLLAGVWSASTGDSLHKASKESPDVGVFVCWTAILLIWIGVVRMLRQRRSAAPSPYAR